MNATTSTSTQPMGAEQGAQGKVLVTPSLPPLVIHAGWDFAAYRLWLLAHQINRDKGNHQTGYVTRIELFDAANALGVLPPKAESAQRTIRRWINAGAEVGLFEYRHQRETLKITSEKKVHAMLRDTLAEQGKADIIATMRLKKRLYVPLTGNVTDFKATCFKAWLQERDKTGKGVTIARDTQAAIWNVSKVTLVDWTKRAGITVLENHAQFAPNNDTANDLIPDHAYPYSAKRDDGTNEARIAWQMPNTYIVSTPLDEHRRAGVLTKLRKSKNETLKCLRADHPGGTLKDTKRRYFTGDNAGKRADRHLRQHRDLDQRHYTQVGIRHGMGIYECLNPYLGFECTELHERDFASEGSLAFTQYKLAWDEFGVDVMGDGGQKLNALSPVRGDAPRVSGAGAPVRVCVGDPEPPRMALDDAHAPPVGWGEGSLDDRKTEYIEFEGILYDATRRKRLSAPSPDAPGQRSLDTWLSPDHRPRRTETRKYRRWTDFAPAIAAINNHSPDNDLREWWLEYALTNSDNAKLIVQFVEAHGRLPASTHEIGAWRDARQQTRVHWRVAEALDVIADRVDRLWRDYWTEQVQTASRAYWFTRYVAETGGVPASWGDIKTWAGLVSSSRASSERSRNLYQYGAEYV